jgi:hypothetical protein
VCLTAAGKRQFRKMAVTHEQWVIELLAGWDSDEKAQVYGLLASLKTHLGTQDVAPSMNGKAGNGKAAKAKRVVKENK